MKAQRIKAPVIMLNTNILGHMVDTYTPEEIGLIIMAILCHVEGTSDRRIENIAFSGKPRLRCIYNLLSDIIDRDNERYARITARLEELKASRRQSHEPNR